ncbi:MAG: hypothetical protein MI919_40155, partial [Holophagales bacterium]|nr:hypothetical protein [Holophagales bacterium]
MRSTLFQRTHTLMRDSFLFHTPQPEPLYWALATGLKLAVIASAPWASLALALGRGLVEPEPAPLGLCIGLAFLLTSSGIALVAWPFFDQLSSWSAKLGELARPGRPGSHAGESSGEDGPFPGLWHAHEALQRRLQEERHTERERAETADQLSRMGHELVTPLNGLLGVADLLETSPLSDHNREMVRALRFSIVSLLGIVRDSLQLVDSEGRPIPPERLELQPERLLQEAVNLLTPRAVIQRAKIELDARHLPPRIRVDAFRLRRVLIHLLALSVRGTRVGRVVLRGTVRAT